LVLYEMATGQLAFSGETAAILHDAILNRPPAPAQKLNPEIPSKLEEIINKALEKDRERRYQAASEMRAALKCLEQGKDAGRRGARWPLAVAGLLALFLVGGAIFWFTNRQLSSLAGRAGLPELKQQQLTANSSENAVVTGAISPDGRSLAYADLKGIHIKLIETGETVNVAQPGSLDGMQVNWGIVDTWVDGTRLIANANVPGRPSSIWTIPLGGGAPHKIRDDATAWSVARNGSWVAFIPNPGREMWLMRPDGGEARKLYQADPNSGFFGAEWAPDGQRLAYYKFHEADNKFDYSIETRDLKSGPATPMIAGRVDDWAWSPDGRMIYALDEPGPTSESCNFWAVGVDVRSGRPIESPKRLTNWAGFCMDIPSVSRDGKRLAFRRWSWQGNVYVADLESDGRQLTTPKRLTLNEGRNYPAAWTPDSKTVVFGSYRDAHWRILKQSLGEDTNETIATGAAGDRVAGGARVSPDGAWILYFAPLNEASSPDDVTVRLMRIPITGGPARLVLTARVPTYGTLNDPLCANSPATTCVIVEQTPDRKQLIFTAFDPVKGRGRELARYEIDNGHAYCWDLSPDGARIAIFKYSEGRIHILRTDGQASQAIAVKGWSSLQSVHWAADGKGLFVSSATPEGAALLHVDLKGNARVLWKQKGSIAPWGGPFDMGMGSPSAPWAVPSPDGRHLAIYTSSLSANMWMMENF
jgi:Tol biopolymer transport system component